MSDELPPKMSHIIQKALEDAYKIGHEAARQKASELEEELALTKQQRDHWEESYDDVRSDLGDHFDCASDLECLLSDAMRYGLEECEALRGKASELEAIVRALAEIEDPYDHYGSSRCWLCSEMSYLPHSSDCPWFRARKASGMDAP